MKKNLVIIVLAIIALIAIALPSPCTERAICADCGQEYETAEMVQMSGANEIVFICKYCLDEMRTCEDCINGTHNPIK